MSSVFRRFLPVFAVAAVVLAALLSPLAVRATISTAPTTIPSSASVLPTERDRGWLDSPRTAPPVVAKGERAARVALSEVGVPYVWGGASPAGFDCSGLVRFSYLRVGIALPHSSYALADLGRRVSRSRLEPGDLLFFDDLGHVGIYVGDGKMVHAPQTGQDVEVVSLSGRYGSSFETARRVAG